MAEKKETVLLATIEELKGKHNITEMVFAGIKAAQNWKTGKQVAEADFLKARTAFLKAPISGAERKKNVQ